MDTEGADEEDDSCDEDITDKEADEEDFGENRSQGMSADGGGEEVSDDDKSEATWSVRGSCPSDEEEDADEIESAVDGGIKSGAFEYK